jgi:D-alanyl-lipoteichoic acid acyltransferase DltB (MBOAT superfamily)
MTILQILILCLVAFLLGAFFHGRWRGWLLLVASLAAVYWLQPFTPIPHLDFWLPGASVALTVFVWAVTRQESPPAGRENWITAGVAAGVVLVIGLLRYLGPVCCLTPSRPPELFQILLAVSLSIGLAVLLWRSSRARPVLLAGFLGLILCVFVILKTEPLAAWVSAGLRSLTGRSAAAASLLDLRWLGFSYIAFRLLHVLRDRQSGRLPEFKLQEFIIYVLFFPTLTAGPIDRSQRFVQNLRKSFTLTSSDLLQSSQRIAWGFFKKFVLADSLAVIALNEAKAAQTTSTLWLWVLVYAYALRIYLDFSGYTDIAIAAGQLLGIKLPENFDRPYLKPNLTAFWNSWHVTLAQWFRAYFFNPLTRAMRSSKSPIPMPFIILTGQLSTMALIGLWHGVTWNFLIWGVWHGMGLFVHNRWAEFIKTRLAGMSQKSWVKHLSGAVSTFLTFQYVALGWVWFALPEPAQSWKVLIGLFGYGQ